MTKFILHGGGEGGGNELHDDFFCEIVKNLPEEAKVLCVYFAVPDELVEEKHRAYEEYFSRCNKNGKAIELKIATRENFIEELGQADAVYFRGGDTLLLLDAIKKYPKFEKEILKKKVVAGSSAGVYFLANYAYSNSRDIIYKGLGILPIKVNCHYTKGKDLSRLEKMEGEWLLLKEGEYKIIER